jgi:uncharacterized membrane protein (UPF0127 family)
MNKTAIYFVVFLAGCVVLFIIGRNLIADHEVPSLGEFIASSTEEFASSTIMIASSTVSLGNLSTSTGSVVENLRMTDFTAPNGVVKAMIADTDASRRQGLSDKPSLPEDAGMLFVFDVPGQYGFWMKDMTFPLDMVWIGADKTVVSVSKDLSPDTYPEVFNPPVPISYVLEINAGSADRLGIIPGAIVDFK